MKPITRQTLEHTPGPTEKPMSAREIHRAVDCWHHISIKNALNALVEEGLVQRTEEPTRGNWGGVRNLYRKVAAS